MKNTHLLGLKDYPREDIQTIIDTGFRFKEILDRPIKKYLLCRVKLLLIFFLKIPREQG